MQRVGRAMETVPSSKAGSAARSGDWPLLARRLSREFGAPVGLLDPSGAVWLASHGADPSLFPHPTPGLIDVLTRNGVALGRTAIWRPDSCKSPVWLCLPLPRPEWGNLVVLAGFAASIEPAGAETWGPVCPDPALRAWGQTVADQLRTDRGSRPRPGSSALRAEGSERIFIARLIRRLKISDTPERFQTLATNALRSALGVEAVVWIPNHPSEAVIVSGVAAGLSGHGYRSLLPASAKSVPIQIVNEPEPIPGAVVRRIAAVAADTQSSPGWLIAVNPLDNRYFADAEIELLQPVASLIATQQSNARIYADLKELIFGIIRALTAAIDAKDTYTSGHSERVARIAVRIAEEMGMSPNQRGDLYLMGLLHDIGKIGIDDNILKKAGPLTDDEVRHVRTHVEIGVHILSDLKKLHHLLPGIRHHHESLDGTGYPAGLAGDAIPLEARNLAVADSFDAMSSTRPYRRRLTPLQIDEILRKGSGIQWDPKVIDALTACRADVEHIRQKGLGESLQAAVNETIGRP